MTEQELARKLRDASVKSLRVGRKTQAMLLFGAWYRDELRGEGINKNRVWELANRRGEVRDIRATIDDGINLPLIFDINDEGRRFGAFLGFE